MGRATTAIFNKQHVVESKYKVSSYRAKFMKFVAAEHCKEFPLLPLFPVTLDTIMVFTVWCSHNGIDGGLDSISNYVSEVIQWGIQYNGQEDPRTDSAKAIVDWRRFSNNFRELVVTVRKLKLRIQPAMYQAIMSTLDVNDWRDMRDGAMYSICFYTSARIGHTAAASALKPKHLLRFKDLVFEPSFENPERIFVFLKSTKTRKENEGKPTWQCMGKLGEEHKDRRLCPVYMVHRWVATQFAGDPEAPLFVAAKEARRHLPCGRTEFADLLKARIVKALPLLDVDIATFDLSKYSGIGFRKGSLSALARSDGITCPRLAAHGDHSTVDVTLHYLSDTTEQRAENSRSIASHFRT